MGPGRASRQSFGSVIDSSQWARQSVPFTRAADGDRVTGLAHRGPRSRERHSEGIDGVQLAAFVEKAVMIMVVDGCEIPDLLKDLFRDAPA